MYIKQDLLARENETRQRQRGGASKLQTETGGEKKANKPRQPRNSRTLDVLARLKLGVVDLS